METAHSTPPQHQQTNSTWYRPREGRVVAGVCAGLARRFRWSLVGLRVLFLLFIPLPISALLVYIIFWIIMPNEVSNF